MLTDDQFAHALFRKEITPEQGLEILKSNGVKVLPDPTGGKERTEMGWGEVEEVGAGASMIQHALFVAGGKALAEDYSAEIARLRREDHTTPF